MKHYPIIIKDCIPYDLDKSSFTKPDHGNLNLNTFQRIIENIF